MSHFQFLSSVLVMKASRRKNTASSLFPPNDPKLSDLDQSAALTMAIVIYVYQDLRSVLRTFRVQMVSFRLEIKKKRPVGPSELIQYTMLGESYSEEHYASLSRKVD
jgi:hypothetical protein